MKNRIIVLCIIFLVMPALAAMWGCGGKGKEGDEDADAITDGVDEGVIDVVTDQDVVTDPLDEDALPDIPVDFQDTQEDAEDVIEDVPEEEFVGPGEPQPYQCETAGGAVLTSDNYRLEVFVAPVRPIGNLSSTNYNLKLGPAGLRSPH